MSAPFTSTLLAYQTMLLTACREHKVVVCEKSRRIGATWAVAGDSVLDAAAARGQNVYYIGYNIDMAREFIDACADWARAMSSVASEVGEVLFDDVDEQGNTREIKALRITFASGYEVIALSSRPRSLRGRQGRVILDEAAFHDDIEEMIKAAVALLMWGGRLLLISTHDGADNPFAQLVDDCRGQRRPYHVVRITFDNALTDGLYRRICERTGVAWTADGEAAWAAEIRETYGDHAGEELDVVPRRSSGRYLPRSLLEARAVDVPVLQWACSDEFVDLTADVREAAALDWFDEHVRPLLERVSATATYLGEDFGRSGDLTVLWPLALESDLTRSTPFVLELRNVPFAQQQQLVFLVIDSMPNFRGACFDARGNGQYLAEAARQKYGPEAIDEVMLSERWYLENMPPAKAALEDGTASLPRNAAVLDDFRAIELVRGVPRVTERTTDKGGKRHGDAAIAFVLAYCASRTLDAGPIDASAVNTSTSDGGYAGASGSVRNNLAGWI